MLKSESKSSAAGQMGPETPSGVPLSVLVPGAVLDFELQPVASSVKTRILEVNGGIRRRNGFFILGILQGERHSELAVPTSKALSRVPEDSIMRSTRAAGLIVDRGRRNWRRGPNRGWGPLSSLQQGAGEVASGAGPALLLQVGLTLRHEQVNPLLLQVSFDVDEPFEAGRK